MASFVPVHENSNQMLRIALLNTKKVIAIIKTKPLNLFYCWIPDLENQEWWFKLRWCPNHLAAVLELLIHHNTRQSDTLI